MNAIRTRTKMSTPVMMFRTMTFDRTTLLAALVAGLIFALTPQVRAAPIAVNVNAPNFFFVPGGWDGTQFTEINPATEQTWKPGDRYQLSFVTGAALGGFDGSSINVTPSDVHGFVNSVAHSTNLAHNSAVKVDGLDWFALASVEDPGGTIHNARDIAVVSAPVYRSDGALVAKDYGQFWDSLQNPIESDGTGTLSRENIGAGGWTLDGPFVWTGTKQDGTAASPLGRPWNDDPSRSRPTAGRADWGSGNNTFDSHRRNTEYLPLYALSGELELVKGPVVLDGTSGANTTDDVTDTGDGLTLSLGFFVDTLAVGGGGGSGGNQTNRVGGGGAGGLVFAPGYNVSAHGDKTEVVVGAGGAPGSVWTEAGSDGESSQFGNLAALGGGGGGSHHGDRARDGSSGGGGRASGSTGSGRSGGAGLQSSPPGGFGFGNDGGNGHTSGTANDQAGGGGGGAGAPGQNGAHRAGGSGGDGLYEVPGTDYNFAQMFGTAYGHIIDGEAWFAGGAGGTARLATSGSVHGQGGKGGGGYVIRGSTDTIVAPIDNTGGGGSGGVAGASGIVIVRYEGPEVAGAGGDAVAHVPQDGVDYHVHYFTTANTTANPWYFDLSHVDMNQRLGTTVTSVISGEGSLTFAGPGTLTLAADNNYMGPTTVNAGTLLVQGDQSDAIGNVTVAAGATLGGAGVIGGATTINGRHTPGASAGIQTFLSDLTYNTDAEAVWDLFENTNVQDTPPVFDQIVVGGDLDFAGETAFTLNFDAQGSAVDWNDAFWESNHDWLVYDVAGTTSDFENLLLAGDNWLDAAGVALNTVHPIASFSLYQGGNNVFLSYAVPEPGTWLLLLAALACGLLVRRRPS